MRLARKGNAMARSLTLISALVLLALPALALAIGLGNVETRSALNQPLEARIPVHSASSDEVDSLRVRLASSDAFERVGLERPFILSRLSFEVEVHDGQPYVVVRTENPVREPFLAFLVEARWSGGRLLREYTLLLDPPVHAPSGAAPPPAAEAERPTTPADTTRAAPSPAPARGATPPGDTAGEYGPVQRNQTAWDVAVATRPDESVTVQQMMMALLGANPDAFGDGNVNNLRAGAVLRVPDRAEIQSMSAADARREFSRQVELWESGRTPSVAEAEEPAPETPPEDEEIAEPAAEDTVLDDGGRLQVVAPSETGGEDAAASLAEGELDATPEVLAQLQQELQLTREEAAGLRAENDELREMAAEMRQRVEALERMLDLELDPGLAGTAGDPGAADGADDGAADAAGADTEAAEAADGAAEARSAEQETAAAPAPTQPVDDQFRTAPPAPWEDPRLQALGAAVLLALLVLLLLIRRRRQAAADQAELEADDTPVSSGAQSSGRPAAAAAVGGSAAAAGAASTAATAVAATDGDGDALAQAESYMGYGRYDEAREVLESALAGTPGNTAYRLKLLEVHAVNEDRPAFEAEAQTLYGRVDGAADPVWQRAVEMGRQVAPENPLFAEDAGSGETLLSEEFELGPEAAAEPDGPAAAERESVEPDAGLDELEFTGLDDEDAAPPQAGESVAAANQAEAPDLAAEPIPEDDLADLESALSDPADNDDDDFADLEFALSDAPEEQNPDANAEQEAQPDAATDTDDALSLDFDLDSSFRGDEPSAADDARQSEDEAQTDADDGFDLEFTLDDGSAGEAPGAESAAEPGQSGDIVDGDEPAFAAADADEALFDNADENSTKLDLARAYLEMGDDEGARSLLEEVMEEGNSSQKQEAEELLEKT